MPGETWRERRFEPATTGSSGVRRFDRPGAWFAAVLLAATSGLAFAISHGRSAFRCRQECYGDPPRYGYGSLTYEPGHPWTHYADSWQWGVHHGLSQLAVAASIVGLVLVATRRREHPVAFAAAALCLAAWTVWALLAPPIPG